MERENASKYIPQQYPFIMVDELVFCDEKSCATSFMIKRDSLFLDEDIFSEAGIIENIAQSCATRIGYIYRPIVKIGMIASLKNLQILTQPRIGDLLETTIEESLCYNNMTIFNTVVKCGEKLIASCEIKVALTDIEIENNHE